MRSMKNFQIILNVILVIAIGVLYYMHLGKGAENNAMENERVEKESIGAEGESSSSNLKVLYVNTDSVWSNFEYVNEIRANLERKQNQYKKPGRSRLSRHDS